MMQQPLLAGTLVKAGACRQGDASLIGRYQGSAPPVAEASPSRDWSATASVDGAKAVSITGLVALILGQRAYALDCADGQLAHATGKATPSGARPDTFVEVTVQTLVLVAVACVVEHWSHPTTALAFILVGEASSERRRRRSPL
jgi:phosphatidylglycerophosphate synthase